MTRFCNWPFEFAWIRGGGRVSICCRMRNGGYTDGNLNEIGFEDAINTDTAQAMRRSILDGTYEYCSPDCPKLFGEHNMSKNTKYQQILENRSLTVTETRHIVLGYDRSCSLACPSCRKGVFLPVGEELVRLKKYHEMVLEKIPAPEEMNVSGSGDAIGSVTARMFLRNFGSYPKFGNTRLTLATNATLLTPKAWASIEESHHNIGVISVSIDGVREETYRKIRTGSFQRLKENMSFLCSQRRHYTTTSKIVKFFTKIRDQREQATTNRAVARIGWRPCRPFRLEVNFIVQKGNYTEMGEMVDLCHHWQVDRLHFIPIRFWSSGAYTKEEMAEQQVFGSTHRLLGKFLECLKDPRLDDAIVDLQGRLGTLKRQCRAT